MNMNWAYIAGFLDGDGCLYRQDRVRRRLSYRLLMYQSGEHGRVLLKDMTRFFQSNGITAHTRSMNRNPAHAESHCLSFSAQDAIKIVLSAIQPWVVLKADKVSLAIEELGHCSSIETSGNWWSYLAGLFDAEGCLQMTRMPKGEAVPSTLTIGMAGENSRDLLLTMKKFLEHEGIRASVYSAQPSKKGNKTVYMLEVSSRRHAKSFLRGVLPYLHVKRTKAQDTLRYLIMFPKPVPLSFPDRIVVEMLEEGIPLVDIAKKLGKHIDTIRNRAKKIGMFVPYKFRAKPSHAPDPFGYL